jgi:hypothetical protein
LCAACCIGNGLAAPASHAAYQLPICSARGERGKVKAPRRLAHIFWLRNVRERFLIRTQGKVIKAGTYLEYVSLFTKANHKTVFFAKNHLCENNKMI